MRGEDGEDNYEGAEDDKVLSKVAGLNANVNAG